jgi:hypothetical protein
VTKEVFRQIQAGETNVSISPLLRKHAKAPVRTAVVPAPPPPPPPASASTLAPSQPAAPSRQAAAAVTHGGGVPSGLAAELVQRARERAPAAAAAAVAFDAQPRRARANGGGMPANSELLAQRSSLRSVPPPAPREPHAGPEPDSVAYCLQVHPQTPNLEPRTQNHRLLILNPRPLTLDPKPLTLNSQL